MYVDFYRFPVLRYEAGPQRDRARPSASPAAPALLGALGAVRRALALPPAEAMRPEAPPRFHRRAARARRPAAAAARPPLRMIVRNLVAPAGARAALSVLGIALAVAILHRRPLLRRRDRVHRRRAVPHRAARRRDRHLPRAAAARARATTSAHLPGVLRAEPFRAVPVRLRFEHRTRRIGAHRPRAAAASCTGSIDTRRCVRRRCRPTACC